MVKRSNEQNLRMKNFDARNGNYENIAVVKNQGMEQCGQNSWTLLTMGVQRAVFKRKQLQFLARYEQACKIETAESFFDIFFVAECEK